MIIHLQTGSYFSTGERQPNTGLSIAKLLPTGLASLKQDVGLPSLACYQTLKYLIGLEIAYPVSVQTRIEDARDKAEDRRAINTQHSVMLS